MNRKRFFCRHKEQSENHIYKLNVHRYYNSVRIRVHVAYNYRIYNIMNRFLIGLPSFKNAPPIQLLITTWIQLLAAVKRKVSK